MTYQECTTLAVFSSGFGWMTQEVRIACSPDSLIEVVFRGHGEKKGRVLRFIGRDGGPAEVAAQFCHGFDDFLVVDLRKKELWREVGRFEVHIFRSDEQFTLAFDSYEIFEEEAPNQAPPTTPGSCAPLRV